MDIEKTLQETCQKYWDIRNRGELGEGRTQAHNEVIALFDSLGISYIDRENVAQMAKVIATGTIPLWWYCALLETCLFQKELLTKTKTLAAEIVREIR